MLKALHAAATLYNVLPDMLSNAWDNRRETIKSSTEYGAGDIRQIEKNVVAVVARITGADSPSIMSAYENEIKRLEAKRVRIKDRWSWRANRSKASKQLFRTAFGFIANPWNLWSSGGSAAQKLVLRLILPTPVTYCKNEGFRTAPIPRPFRVFRGSGSADWGMVEGAGFEPA
ncbi:MAG: hypothetical protein AAF675_01235 [Pseudomonadota bacterium]